VASIVFITGIPSSGKSTVAKGLLALDPSFELVETDVEIRKAGLGASTLLNARRIFRRVLDKIEALSKDATVVVDGSLPASYAEEARERFGDKALFVTLRVSESERRRRERTRRDRSPVQWNEGMTALGGGPELYDLVIDSVTTTPGCGAGGLRGTVGATRVVVPSRPDGSFPSSARRSGSRRLRYRFAPYPRRRLRRSP
jgi:chloramphenicol 3-O-phosphotransferase